MAWGQKRLLTYGVKSVCDEHQGTFLTGLTLASDPNHVEKLRVIRILPSGGGEGNLQSLAAVTCV